MFFPFRDKFSRIDAPRPVARHPPASQAPADPPLQPPQFGKSPEPPNSAVSRVGILTQVVQHLVPMIRPHRQGCLSTPHQQYQLPDHGIHIYIPVQMIGLEKIAVCIPPGASKMNEMDMIPQPANHASQIIIGPHAERTGTKTDPIGRRIGGSKQLYDVLLGTDDPRQAQYRVWRIIRMNGHFQTRCFRHGHDLPQKIKKMLLEFFCIDALIGSEGRQYLFFCKTLLAAGKAQQSVSV